MIGFAINASLVFQAWALTPFWFSSVHNALYVLRGSEFASKLVLVFKGLALMPFWFSSDDVELISID